MAAHSKPKGLTSAPNINRRAAIKGRNGVYDGSTLIPDEPDADAGAIADGDDGEVSEGRATAAAAARSKMTKLRATLLDVGDIDTGRRVWHAAMEVAVMDNQACRTWPDHMIDYLRRGLNRLSDFYGGLNG